MTLHLRKATPLDASGPRTNIIVLCVTQPSWVCATVTYTQIVFETRNWDREIFLDIFSHTQVQTVRQRKAERWGFFRCSSGPVKRHRVQVFVILVMNNMLIVRIVDSRKHSSTLNTLEIIFLVKSMEMISKGSPPLIWAEINLNQSRDNCDKFLT